MTGIHEPMSSLPGMAPDRWPSAAGSGAWVPDELPLWLVMIPTVARDGACGVQWFAVRALTPAQAIADAAKHAGSTQAVLRRRGARIRIEEAQVAPWNA